MIEKNKTGIIRLLDLKNHDRIDPVFKLFICLIILLIVGTILNKKILYVGGGFIVFVYTIIFAFWIKNNIS